ncbi:YagK/YfjJ domain-containing protein [Enterobacter ludwigii]|uniref:YagK/YfjJ domain-containing protein n=1 Tax=Enterobacter ludwigii TaxID=299767 RepID=UPI001239C386|nr:inovirus-type Gp2 protein [Enterobacter ludwigii]
MINKLETGSTKLSSTTVFNNISPDSIAGIPSKGIFIFKDVLWPVQHADDEQDKKIMGKVFEAVNKVSTMSRFLAVRYDFHLPVYSPDNQVVSAFHELLFKELNNSYPRSFISYIWVREEGDEKKQHYHYLLMMDGNYVRYPSNVNKIVKSCWENATKGTVYFPVNAYYSVTKNDIEKYTELMFRISYFGKKRTKETIAKGIRRVGQGFKKPKPCSCKPQHASDLPPRLDTTLS